MFLTLFYNSTQLSICTGVLVCYHAKSPTPKPQQGGGLLPAVFGVMSSC